MKPVELLQIATLTVQPIYHPGFTFAGFAEPLALLCTSALLLLTPRGSAEFWLTATAFGGLTAMHAVYWLVTHPVNKYWLRGEKLGADWRAMRDRWEYSPSYGRRSHS